MKIAHEINWETDGEKAEVPKMLAIPDWVCDGAEADYLSDKTGWLVQGMNLLDVDVEDLPPELLEAAYAYQKEIHLIEDAKTRVEELRAENPSIPLLEEEQYWQIANLFILNRNCNVPENDTWEFALRDFFQKLEEERGNKDED